MAMLKRIFGKKEKESQEGYDDSAKMSKEDFDSLRLLGKGSFGKVVLVRKKDDGAIYAMKVIMKESIIQHKRVQDVFTERGVLRRANHPFLCKMHFTFQSDHKLFFIMDYYHGGDLDGYLNRQKDKKLSPATTQIYGGEVLHAVQYLHESGIIYRDLKPENILMRTDGHLVLSDFGLAKDFGEFSLDDCDRTASFVGSPFYVAPDVLKQKQYSNAIDYWSFGILMFRMASARPPFMGRSMKEVFDNILYQELRFSQSNPIDTTLQDLCKILLIKDATKRAKGDAVKKHRYWTTAEHGRVALDWDKLLAKAYPLVGWQPPPPLELDKLEAQAHTTGGDASPKAVAATPANAAPLQREDQELFDGFTYTAQGQLKD
eukprot:TRINITY_DN2301_c0_g1_i1.p1 TRINITY_DN2301_c0_g1~~TRINITY_DN2301_c0_g1_i1.p1  ORF type:complete len:374 (+),score=165.36 TRINITY_DN2301_c0_g1_i1:113-1234(+)